MSKTAETRAALEASRAFLAAARATYLADTAALARTSRSRTVRDAARAALLAEVR